MPESLAAVTSGAAYLYSALGIIEAEHQTDCPLLDVAGVYFDLGESLSLSWFRQKINELPSSTHWDALARETLRDDLDHQQRSLTEAVVVRLEGKDAQEEIMAWKLDQQDLVKRWDDMLSELQNAPSISFQMVSVALRELLDLAQASHQ